jgi:glycosyltransferase involved in cell wall biosynthesis
MMRVPEKVNTVVIIPARNEEQRIAGCLHALAHQCEGAAIVIVANNCTDRTVEIARATGNELDLSVEIHDCTIDPVGGVGKARRLGCDDAQTRWPGVQYLLTTDADCLVAADWVERSRFHLTEVAAVCGQVLPMASELTVLAEIEVTPAEMEARYEALVMAFYRRFNPGPCGLDGDHGCAAGASLGVRADAYHRVGGFHDIGIGEDRDIVRRLKAAGFGVRHAADVRVAASCRLDGRTGGGMAEALRVRATRTAYLIDDALPPARMMIKAARTGDLGHWPLQVAPHQRLRACDLAPEIALLEEALLALQPMPPPRVTVTQTLPPIQQ